MIVSEDYSAIPTERALLINFIFMDVTGRSLPIAIQLDRCQLNYLLILNSNLPPFSFTPPYRGTAIAGFNRQRTLVKIHARFSLCKQAVIRKYGFYPKQVFVCFDASLPLRILQSRKSRKGCGSNARNLRQVPFSLTRFSPDTNRSFRKDVSTRMKE